MACSFQCWKKSNNSGATGMKMDGSILEEKLSFKVLELFFSSRLNWIPKLSLLLKLPPRKLEP